MPHRLFAAVRPPAEVRDQLIDIMEGVDGARWQDEEQLHLTLHFIGDCDRHEANDIAATLADIRCPAFPITLAGVGRFERKGMAHTLFAEVEAGPELKRLQQAVEYRCRALVSRERHRKYYPHVTIARANRSSAPFDAWLLRHARFRSDPFTAHSFTLYESHLDTTGARYEAVRTYALE